MGIQIDGKPISSKAVAEAVFDAVCVFAVVAFSAPLIMTGDKPAGDQPLAILILAGIAIVTWKLVRRWKVFDR